MHSARAARTTMAHQKMPMPTPSTALQVFNTCCPDNYCDDVLLKFDFHFVCSKCVQGKKRQKR